MYEKIKSIILGYSTLGTVEDFMGDFDLDFFVAHAKIEGDKKEVLDMVKKAVDELSDPNIGPWTIVAESYETTEHLSFEDACYRADCLDGKVKVLNGNGFVVYEIK